MFEMHNILQFFCFVQVLDVALGRVSSANLADLPTVIKFVMQQVTSKNAQEVCQHCVACVITGPYHDCNGETLLTDTPKMQTSAVYDGLLPT